MTLTAEYADVTELTDGLDAALAEIDLSRLDLSGLAPLHPVLPHVVVYTLPVCPNCERLKKQMVKNDVPAISIPLDEHPRAQELFRDRLGLRSTPIALAHNVFDRPVYYNSSASIPIDQNKYALSAFKERLAVLEVSDQMPSAADYLEAIGTRARANAERDGGAPVLHAEEFAALAEMIIPRQRLQGPAVTLRTEVNLLTTDKTKLPPVLR